MYVTYLGYRLERKGRNRIDIRDDTGRLVHRKTRWTEAVEWIEMTDQKERPHGHEIRPATATHHYE